MTTDTIEISDALGEPLELYRFEYGTGASTKFTYCDSDMAVTVDTDVYRPAYIEREAINASGSLDKSDLEVTLAEDTDVAALFLVYPPSEVVVLTIFHCHFDESTGTVTTPQAVWVGRVLSAARDGYGATLRCEPIATSMRRVGLRRHYQYMCPHVLYGTACGANRADHTVGTSLISADARSVVVPGQVSNQYLGGLVSWTPTGKPVERRTILAIAYDSGLGQSRLTTAGPVRDAEAGAAITLAKGCKHTLADCRDVFDNAPSFGGQPFIPTKNPHGTTAIYN